MRKFLGVFLLLFIFGLAQGAGVTISEKFHTWGQRSEMANTIVMSVDLMDFMTGGGGYFGASHNYFGWTYQRAVLNPNRPLWHKALFWPNPYYVTEPPEAWPWPLLPFS